MFRILLVLGLCLSVANTAWSDPPGDVPEGFDRSFVPHAGYRRTARLLRTQRLAFDAGNFAPGDTLSVSGTRTLPVILLEFANRPGPFPAARFEQMIFGVGPAAEGSDELMPTMRQYYRDISHGKFDIDGQVVGWFRAPQNDVVYENNRFGAGPPFGELLEFGLSSADNQMDFGQFDNDGVDGIPNSGDDDGKVDTVLFIHAEEGAEVNRASGNIWSHSWHYSEPTYGHTGPYVTNDIRLGSDGQPVLEEGQPARIVVEDYTIQPALSVPTPPGGQPTIATIGVYCHEYGHALGLPDLYDRTPRSSADSHGVSDWCLMASGSYNRLTNRGDCPASMSAWCKQYLGWADVMPLTFSRLLQLEPVEHNGRVYRFDVDDEGLEYFLIELRDPSWTGPGRLNWDRGAAGGGVLVWHIDENVGAASPRWPMADPGAGQNDSPSLPGASHHSLVALEQADQRLDLENKRAADTGDLWTTGEEFAGETNAGSKRYDGQSTGFKLTNIQLAQSQAQIEIPAGPDAAPPAGPAGPSGAMLALGEFEARYVDESAAFLSGVESQLQLGVTPQIAEDVKQKLAQLPIESIREGISKEYRGAALQLAIAERMETVSADAVGQTTAARMFWDAIAPAAANRTFEIQVDRTGRFVERATNLALAVRGDSIETDAQSRLQQEFAALYGELKFAIDRERSSDSTVWLQQMFDVNGESLPIWGNYLSFQYSSDRSRLDAIVANLATPGTIELEGEVRLSAEECLDLVRRTTKLSYELTSSASCRKGIYLVGGDSARARVAYRSCIPMGEQQEEIHLVVDAETGLFVEIK